MPAKPPHEDEPMQKTRPSKGEPIDIPVPKRGDFMKLVKRAAQPRQKPKR